MASFQKTARGYRAQVYVNGRRESKSFRTLREARAWAESHAEALRAEAADPLGRWTLEEALRRYAREVSPGKRGARWELVRIEALCRDPAFPAGERLGTLTTQQLAAWRDARLAKVSAGAVLRDISLLSAILETARRDWQWLKVNPLTDMRRPRMPDHREVVIQPWQVRRLLAAMGYSPRRPVRSVAHAVAVCTLLALRTGMRAGELCGLTWDRVQGDFCVLPVTKTVPRQVPLTRKALRLLEKMRKYDPVSVFGLTPQSLDANFRKYRQRVGLEGFTFHDTRHTAATLLARRIDVLDLCRMFGWSSAGQALTYYNPSASSIAALLNRGPGSRGRAG
jgi:integrase